jgi:arginine/lysine/histidine transporter system substrate-binding protein
MILFITGCGKNTNELVMVTEAGFAPYEYYENGEIVGVDVDIAKEIAKELGKELVIKDVAFDSIINEVRTGKADFGAAGISYSEERSESVDFSLNYVVSKNVVITKANSNITLNNIDGKKIAVQLGSIGDTYATENFKNSEIIRQKKYLAAAQDLKTDKVDLIIMDELPAKEIVNVNNDLKILDGFLTSDSYGMIVQKGNKELLDTINKVINKLKDEGKIDEFILNHMAK